MKKKLASPRISFFVFVVSALCGCATTSYKMPDMTYSEKARVQEQISNSPDRAERSVTMGEATAKLTRIYNTIAPEARLTCRQQGERSTDKCNDWPIGIEDLSLIHI